MRRILEESDGEDDFMQDILENSVDANVFLQLQTEEDVLTISEFIESTMPSGNSNHLSSHSNIAEHDEINFSSSHEVVVQRSMNPAENLTLPATSIQPDEAVLTLSEFIENTMPSDNSNLSHYSNFAEPDDAINSISSDEIIVQRSSSRTPAVNLSLPTTWQNTLREMPREEFTGYSRGKRHEELFSENLDLWTIFNEIYNEDVNQLMVDETNRYAPQKMLEPRHNKPTSRIKRWKPVTSEEMKKFVGIYLLTGLLNFPTIECCWKTDKLYYHPLLHDLKMAYNRFALLLRCWRFSDNEQRLNENHDRLYKVQPLIDKVVNNFRKIYTPGEMIAVDESMVGFRGKLSFRTFNPQKANKYGIKIYKLCTTEGYTWSYSIYDGRSSQLPHLDKPGTVVVSLSESLLNEDRLLIADNYYSSVPLARYLKQRKTEQISVERYANTGVSYQDKSSNRLSKEKWMLSRITV